MRELLSTIPPEVESLADICINNGKIDSALYEKYDVKRCFYGHLHGGSHKLAMEGLWDGVDFKLCAADYLGFKPFKVFD